MCEKEEETTCGQPCDPDADCDECEAYWETMVSQGLWDRERHRWTDKGWASITRSF
jgi:hypothetical protein